MVHTVLGELKLGDTSVPSILGPFGLSCGGISDQIAKSDLLLLTVTVEEDTRGTGVLVRHFDIGDVEQAGWRGRNGSRLGEPSSVIATELIAWIHLYQFMSGETLPFPSTHFFLIE